MQPTAPGDRLRALAFLILGVGLVVGATAFLTGWPFRPARRLFVVEFDEPVAALDVGSGVRYLGVKKGVIAKMDVDGSSRIVRVTLAVDADLRLTTSTKAKISAAALLGPYFVDLVGDGTGSPLEDGATIPADESTMRRLVEAGTTTVERLDALIEDLRRLVDPTNRERVARLLDATTKAVENVDAAVTELRPETVRLAGSWADLGRELTSATTENRDAFRRLVEDAATSVARLRTLLESGRVERVAEAAENALTAGRDEIRATGGALRTYLDQNRIGPELTRAVDAIERLERATTSALGAVEGEAVSAARGEIAPALRALRDAARSLQELTAALRNDPALLLFAEPRPEIPVPRPKDGR